jgi:hypothetical protein
VPGGTVTSLDRGDPAIYAEFEVRSLTGVGAEEAVAHSRTKSTAAAGRLWTAANWDLWRMRRGTTTPAS